MGKTLGKRILTGFLVILLAVPCIALSSCGGGGGGSSSGGSSGASVGDLVSKVGDLASGGKNSIEEDESLPDRDNKPRVLENSADGTATFGGNGATVDYSNASDGYIMAEYEGDNEKIKLQITHDGGSTYTYNITPNAGFLSFPLSAGSGGYSIAVFLNIGGDQYSQAAADSIQANISDEFAPFLRPNRYSNFTNNTGAVVKGSEVAAGAKSDLKVIENAFVFVTKNVKYDYDKAATVQSGYVPDVDDTLNTGKGICFDYAALMVCMLRTQRIPCQLVVGYAGDVYHAWISVYVDGVGWVANMIQFNADTWTMMDPTFAAGGDTADPNLVGSGDSYNPVYYY